MKKCKRYMDYVSSKEWSPHVFLLLQEAGQGLDVRVIYRKCELFQACRLSRSRALFQDPPAADGRCWGLYYFSPSSSP